MRICPVYLNPIPKSSIDKKNKYFDNQICRPEFKGKIGTRVGVVAGGITAIALAFFVAPVLACAGPILAVLGGYSASEAEDKIKNRNKKG